MNRDASTLIPSDVWRRIAFDRRGQIRQPHTLGLFVERERREVASVRVRIEVAHAECVPDCRFSKTSTGCRVQVGRCANDYLWSKISGRIVGRSSSTTTTGFQKDGLREE